MTSSSSTSSSSPWGSTTTTTIVSLGVGVVTGAYLVLQLQKQRRLPQQHQTRRTDSTALTKLRQLFSTSPPSSSSKLSGSSNQTCASTTNRNRFYYLDYNGTTPVYEEVFDAMVPYFKEHYGNPSSSHRMGTEPRKAIDESRRTILTTLLGCSPREKSLDESSIWMCGCGTEADNLAIQLALQSDTRHGSGGRGDGGGGTAGRSTGNKPHIVTTNVEHPAVELYLKYLEEELGVVDVTYVPVDGEGRVSAKDVLDAITDDTILVTVMLANNESGSLQPVREIARGCRDRGVLMHTDAAQAAGKVSIHLEDIGHPDMISIVGHKIGAPKGIAALYVRPSCLSEEEHGRKLSHNHGILLIGGGQEFGRRGGTENTPYIVGLGKAAELAEKNLEANAKHMEKMRSRLLHNLQAKLGGDAKIRVNGPTDPSKRLPNTLSVGFDSVHSGALLSTLSQVVAASAGATCHGTGSVSSVLMAMKVPLGYARGTLRLSLGPGTTAADVDEASKIIADAVKDQWAAAAQ